LLISFRVSATELEIENPAFGSKVHPFQGYAFRTRSLKDRETCSDCEKPVRIIYLDESIHIGGGEWWGLNENQLAIMGLTSDQIDLLCESSKATLRDFLVDPQGAADAAFPDDD